MPAWLRQGLPCAAATILALLSTPASVQSGTLEGRLVTFSVETWAEGGARTFGTEGPSVLVGDAVEFGMAPEGRSNGLELVPVTVEIKPERIEITYPDDPLFPDQRFVEAAFNGYVLRFAADCALFDRVEIDRSFTTMAISDSDIRTDQGALYINVSGRSFGREARIGLDLSVADCPMS